MKNKTRKSLPMDMAFERLRAGVFISGPTGGCAELTRSGFSAFSSGRTAGAAAERRLSAAGLVRSRLDFPAVEQALGMRYLSGWRGPRVHILTLTGRCSLRCAYCSASSNSASSGGSMSLGTVKRVLDFIFSIEAPWRVIEFQGGEPLLNFGALKYAVKEASERAAKSGSNIHFSVVTSLSGMDEEKFRFLMEHRVTVCTSLDGPRDLHDANRGKGSHAAAVKWLGRINKYRVKHPETEAPNAICTVTRAALSRPEDIVDAFVSAGVDRVQLGPLDPLGRAAAGWGGLGYGPEEFVAFYSRALRRMEKLTVATGRPVYEKGALSFFRQTESGRRPAYRNLDLAFRLAYNCDGGIYGSDEGRMLAGGGDGFFRLGTSGRDTFAAVLRKPLARALLLSCFPELAQPRCARCAFSPYCRVSPVYNYSAQGSFWGDMFSNQRCELFKGVFKLLAEARHSPRRSRIFRKWLDEVSG